LTNFSNGKQPYESLENVFPETTFRETNTALIRTTSFSHIQILT